MVDFYRTTGALTPPGSRKSAPYSHCQARRGAPSSLKSEPSGTSAGPIPLLHGLIHTVAAAVSKNLCPWRVFCAPLAR